MTFDVFQEEFVCAKVVDEVQWSEKGWTKLVVNFDTGAAITAVPKHFAENGLLKGDLKSSSTSYKTASGELLRMKVEF